MYVNTVSSSQLIVVKLERERERYSLCMVVRLKWLADMVKLRAPALSARLINFLNVQT